MIVKGRDVALYTTVNGVISEVALSTNCELNISADMIEISSVYVGRGKSFRPGRYSWSLACDALVSLDNGENTAFIDAIITGQRLTARFSSAEVKVIEGDVYVQTHRETGSMGSLSTYSVTLQGTGELRNVNGTA